MADDHRDNRQPPYSRLALVVTLGAIVALVAIDYLHSTQ